MENDALCDNNLVVPSHPLRFFGFYLLLFSVVSTKPLVRLFAGDLRTAKRSYQGSTAMVLTQVSVGYPTGERSCFTVARELKESGHIRPRVGILLHARRCT